MLHTNPSNTGNIDSLCHTISKISNGKGSQALQKSNCETTEARIGTTIRLSTRIRFYRNVARRAAETYQFYARAPRAPVSIPRTAFTPGSTLTNVCAYRRNGSLTPCACRRGYNSSNGERGKGIFWDQAEVLHRVALSRMRLNSSRLAQHRTLLIFASNIEQRGHLRRKETGNLYTKCEWQEDTKHGTNLLRAEVCVFTAVHCSPSSEDVRAPPSTFCPAAAPLQ